MTYIGFVRSDMVEAKPAPSNTSGAVAWARKHLFATPLDSVLTILGLLFLLWAVPPIFNFFIGHAVGPNGPVEECRLQGAGACWADISTEMELFI